MPPPSSAPTDPAPWLKPAVEWGPLIAFFASYMALGLLPATGVLIVATAAAAAVSFAVERRIPWMPVFTAAIVSLFGGLTLVFNDETFIKLKPTFAQALMAAVLAAGALRNRLFLKLLMGKALAMSDQGWRILTWRFVGLLTVGALLNEAVWRTQTNDVWVAFKVFGLIGLTLVFMIAQAPLIHRHALPPDAAGSGADGRPHDPAG